MSQTREIGLTPVGNRIIVARAEPELQRGAVVLTEAPAKELDLGVVLAVGPPVRLSHPDLRPGDAVYFPKYTGTEIQVNGSVVVFLRPAQLVGRAVSGSMSRDGHSS